MLVSGNLDPKQRVPNLDLCVFSVIFGGSGYHGMRITIIKHHLREKMFWNLFHLHRRVANPRKPCKLWDKLPTSTGDRRIIEPSAAVGCPRKLVKGL